MSKLDPAIEAHRQWLGFAQPVGLVVSPHALVAAQAYPDKNIAPRQEVLLRFTEPPDDALDDAPRAIRDFARFLTEFLGWQSEVIAGANGGGYLYCGEVPAERPAAHYTPRVVPAHAEALVPAEARMIRWFPDAVPAGERR